MAAAIGTITGIKVQIEPSGHRFDIRVFHDSKQISRRQGFLDNSKFTRQIAFECKSETGADEADLFNDLTQIFHSYESDQKQKNKLRLVNLEAITERAVDWLIPNFLPRGMVAILSGDPGMGKSYVSMAIAAQISAGGLVADQFPTSPQTVFYLSAEDDANVVLKPRARKLGAAPERIFIPDNRIVFNDETLADLSELIQDHHAGLIVIDTIYSYFGYGRDTNSATSVRETLDALAEVAANTHCTILVITHKSKNGTAVLGSTQFVGAARVVLSCEKNPDDESDRGVFVVKSNIGADGDAVEPLGYSVENGVFSWQSTTLSWAQVRAGARPEEPDKLDAAIEWLEKRLANGRMPAKETISAGRKAGHAKRTLERAKKELEYETTTDNEPGRGGYGRVYYWGAPSDSWRATSTPTVTPSSSPPPQQGGDGGEV